ncbi:MAG: hypothetical protein WCK78_07745 [Paludibacter sp.]
MKRITYYFLSFIALTFMFNSCSSNEIVFDQNLLIGKWVSGTEYYRYDTGGKGVTWDTADNVTEAEGQAYTWTLVNADLTHIHILTTGGGGVPKIYTVTELTTSTLKYKDEFNKTYSYTKVK